MTESTLNFGIMCGIAGLVVGFALGFVISAMFSKTEG